MKTYQIGDVTLELVVGDITRQSDCRAVVNAANAQLMMGGGVAGPGLYEECRPLAPIQPGEDLLVVMEPAYN